MKNNIKAFFSKMSTPIGEIFIIASKGAITHISWEESIINDMGAKPTFSKEPESTLLKKAVQEIEEYFAKKRRIFSLPLRPMGTPFQLSVWNSLLRIPWGETRSYSYIAKEIGKINTSRAVGNACGKNPIPIIIPCHRVVTKEGKLGGFSSGTDKKKWLLSLEGHTKYK